MNKKRIILIAVAAAIIVGGSVWLFGGAKAKHKVTYATATINKGEISESVTAGKSSVSCPLKPSDSAPLKHSTMPP